MSGIWGWFGGASAQKRKDSPKNAILGLRSQLDMLQKRENHLRSQVNEQDALARKYVGKDKAAALSALKRKKNLESRLEQTLAQINTLEQQINAIESANINRETLAAMEKASEAMKMIHVGLTPEKVDETMEKIRDQNALSDEIVNALTSGTVGEPVDEEELLNELDELQQEQLDESLIKTGVVPVGDAVHKMPAVPNGEDIKGKAIEEDDEEAELRKLQAEMAM